MSFLNINTNNSKRMLTDLRSISLNEKHYLDHIWRLRMVHEASVNEDRRISWDYKMSVRRCLNDA